MRCSSQGELRAYLDGELQDAAQAALERHLTTCRRCSQALARLEQAVTVVESRWQLLAPCADPSPARALNAFETRAHEQSHMGGVWMKTYRSRVWRPVLASALALAVIVGVFSFAPSRALARQLLAVFRVRQFAAIQVNPNQDQLEQIEQELIAKLFVSEPEILADEPEVQVANLEEAQALAGFAARKPSFAPGGDLRLDVKGRTTYALRFTGEGLRALLTMADMSPDLAPPDLTEAEVVVTMPAAVHLGNERFDVIQIYHPEVEYPEGINAQLIGEAALRIMGLKASEAQRIAQSIDWTSTLVLPVPSSIATFQEVAVAGETGILLTPRDDVSGEQRALLWQKDGLVYVISGSMAGETLLQVAESMF